jgi:hypothetical protein
VLGGDEAVEGEAGGADAHDEGEALGAVFGASEEEMGYGLGDGATGAQGGWCEFELVEESVQPDVAYAQLGEHAALRSAQPFVQPRDGFGRERRVECFNAVVPRGGDPFFLPARL